jgi:[acyl-carrier-protein] S-malonyltransferase
MGGAAFIFPGQGSQYVGMSKSFYDAFKSARDLFDEADAALGMALGEVIFNGPAEELDRTAITQPALLTASIAAYRVLGERMDLKPACMAGHSLGEYTALVAAGVLGFADAVRLVHLRGKFMQESVGDGVGAMCAVLGLDADLVGAICSEATKEGSVVVPANINSPAQVVVSGHAQAVKRAATLAKERGARKVIELKVSAPSHSPLMAGAADRLAEELDKIELKPFSLPVYSNVEAAPIGDVTEVPALLRRQLVSPVLWADTILRMKGYGIGVIVEVGPGRVLSGLVKRIDKSIKTFNLDNAGELDALATSLEGGH